MQEDERMQMLARFLTEQWGTSILTACSLTYRAAVEPCPFTCIEYPPQTDNTHMQSSRRMDLAKASALCLSS